jgi:hypothetical protein
MEVTIMLNFLCAINMDNLFVSLDILWKGLLAICIVIVAIIIVTMILNKSVDKIQTKKEEKQKSNDEQTNG